MVQMSGAKQCSKSYYFNKTDDIHCDKFIFTNIKYTIWTRLLS